MLRFELGRLLLLLEYTRALIHAQFSLGWRCLLTSIDENDDGSSAWAVVRWLLPLGACSRLSEPEEEVPEGCALRKDICSSEREREEESNCKDSLQRIITWLQRNTHTHTHEELPFSVFLFTVLLLYTCYTVL